MANTTDDVSEILIERLKLYAANPNDFIEHLRSVAARLHSRSASQGIYFSFFFKNISPNKVHLPKDYFPSFSLFRLTNVYKPFTSLYQIKFNKIPIIY